MVTMLRRNAKLLIQIETIAGRRRLRIGNWKRRELLDNLPMITPQNMKHETKEKKTENVYQNIVLSRLRGRNFKRRMPVVEDGIDSRSSSTCVVRLLG